MSDLLLFSFWTKAIGDCLHYWVNLTLFMDSPQSPPALKSSKLKTDQYSILPHFISFHQILFNFLFYFHFTLHLSCTIFRYINQSTSAAPFPRQLLHHIYIDTEHSNISFSIFHFLVFGATFICNY